MIIINQRESTALTNIDGLFYTSESHGFDSKTHYILLPRCNNIIKSCAFLRVVVRPRCRRAQILTVIFVFSFHKNRFEITMFPLLPPPAIAIAILFVRGIFASNVYSIITVRMHTQHSFIRPLHESVPVYHL